MIITHEMRRLAEEIQSHITDSSAARTAHICKMISLTNQILSAPEAKAQEAGGECGAVCKAGTQDGVACPDDECDFETGVRTPHPIQQPVAVAGDVVKCHPIETAPKKGAFFSWCRWYMVPNPLMCGLDAQPYWTSWNWRNTWMHGNQPQGDGSPLYYVQKVEATHWQPKPPAPIALAQPPAPAEAETELHPIPDSVPKPLAAAALAIQEHTSGEWGLKTARLAIEAYEAAQPAPAFSAEQRAELESVRKALGDLLYVYGTDNESGEPLPDDESKTLGCIIQGRLALTTLTRLLKGKDDA